MPIGEDKKSESQEQIESIAMTSCADPNVVNNLYQVVERTLHQLVIATLHVLQSITQTCVSRLHARECKNWLKTHKNRIQDLIQCAHDKDLLPDVVANLQAHLGTYNRMAIQSAPSNKTPATAPQGLSVVHSTGPGFAQHLHEQMQQLQTNIGAGSDNSTGGTGSGWSSNED